MGKHNQNSIYVVNVCMYMNRNFIPQAQIFKRT